MDNEFARYLASFLVQREHEFVHVQDDSGLWLDEDRMCELIKEFQKTLP